MPENGDYGKYQCPTCWGTGSIESSDSTDDSWWDCRRCEGTGKLADRRRPQGAVADRDRWIRAFNSLEKAVTNVLDDDHPANLDYLARAHRAVLREVAPKP